MIYTDPSTLKVSQRHFFNNCPHTNFALTNKVLLKVEEGTQARSEVDEVFEGDVNEAQHLPAQSLS